MPVLIAAAAAMLVLMAVAVAAFTTIIPGAASPYTACQPGTGKAVRDIPPNYLTLYQQAGRRYGIDWTVLAAVGKIESDHGRGHEPGVTTGSNTAGAAGPMQFLTGTWAAFGIDGNGDGRKDVYDPADAVPAAASYLRHNGAARHIRQALYRYNHSTAYVEAVLRQARTYASTPAAESRPECASTQNAPASTPGRAAAAAMTFARTQLGKPYVFSRGPDGGVTVDPHVCPAHKAGAGNSRSATGVAQAGLSPMQQCVAARTILYAAAQVGKPYVWGTEGPDAFDCSGLTMMAYRAAGVSIPRVTFTQWSFGRRVRAGHEELGDLVFFDSGPNSSPGHPGHVGIVLDPQSKMMIVAPHSGDHVKIASYWRNDLMGFTRPAAR